MASTVQIRSLPDLTGARRGGLLAYRRLLLAFLLAGATVIILILSLAGFPYASGRRWRSRMAGS
jgi:hypothetical protein